MPPMSVILCIQYTVDAAVPALFVANNVDTVTHGHSIKLFIQQSHTDACKFFFLNHVIHSWNSLPAASDDCSSLACFRRFLEQTDLSRFKVGSY